jgi:predicted DNA-binding transcriptional regulator AlpA
MMTHYFSAAQLQRRYDVSRSTLYRWQNDPKIRFPEPLKIGRRVLWRDCDLNEFDERIARPSAGSIVTQLPA